jgi:hypothetical protein
MMGATRSGRIDAEPWTTENSALFTLLIGTAGTVFVGPEVGGPGLAGGAATAVAAAIVTRAAFFAVGLLGRFVALPFPRVRALNAAVFLGFGAVIANGLLAARSVWFTDGPGELLAVTALIAVSVLAVLGGLLSLGLIADSR